VERVRATAAAALIAELARLHGMDGDASASIPRQGTWPASTGSVGHERPKEARGAQLPNRAAAASGSALSR
jgi:hypothetical protein